MKWCETVALPGLFRCSPVRTRSVSRDCMSHVWHMAALLCTWAVKGWQGHEAFAYDQGVLRLWVCECLWANTSSLCWRAQEQQCWAGSWAMRGGRLWQPGHQAGLTQVLGWKWLFSSQLEAEFPKKIHTFTHDLLLQWWSLYSLVLLSDSVGYGLPHIIAEEIIISNKIQYLLL